MWSSAAPFLLTPAFVCVALGALMRRWWALAACGLLLVVGFTLAMMGARLETPEWRFLNPQGDPHPMALIGAGLAVFGLVGAPFSFLGQMFAPRLTAGKVAVLTIGIGAALTLLLTW